MVPRFTIFNTPKVGDFFGLLHGEFQNDSRGHRGFVGGGRSPENLLSIILVFFYPSNRTLASQKFPAFLAGMKPDPAG